MTKHVYGGASFSSMGAFQDSEGQAEVLSILLANGVTNIDTARIYQGSEEAIGKLSKRTEFVIDTKLAGGFMPGTLPDAVADAKASLETVKIPQFDILYIHAPDASVPLEQTLSNINAVHKAGIFRRFGLSNYSVDDVQKVYDHCKENSFVLPTVYQGNYNPVARHYDTQLFPTLRRLGIAFYAYSPLAGGFLTKTTADIDAGVGRFGAEALGGLYKALYDKPSLRQALAQWNEAAQKEGVAKAELAYRWVAYHSALKEDQGDAVIFGASSVRQIEQTLQGLKKGPLSEEAVRAIEGIWESVKKDAPVDNYTASVELKKK
ncbi:Aldo/keto reductase [Dothidotthia symphoricarpi CBS 119687]|uniref:Aldo/keto reductase n=1 Tax=Dothidotthia symphoricarpi CBS 119687 TaxID=1392245 RepID=A0A6A6A191_9PLEO|nr:Aldo/keto reductase [Dothidotthia symphoricarpi CBS 119687]KAF2125286.1 Aldo/keto reductase [Dothidotthia symphoricarpi CBS 119687]